MATVCSPKQTLWHIRSCGVLRIAVAVLLSCILWLIVAQGRGYKFYTFGGQRFVTIVRRSKGSGSKNAQLSVTYFEDGPV